jgi:hypothetical protein
MRNRRREFELEVERALTLAETVTLAPAESAIATAERPATRASVARSAQQRAGNRAVSGVLARDDNPALKHAPPPPLKEPGEVDALFDTSVHMKNLIGAKLGKGSLEKAMILDDAAAFEAAWAEYALRSINPETGQNFASEDEARAFLKKKGVRAFQDTDRGKIHINKERSNLGTQLHEALHFFSSDRWKSRIGYAANEGVTEYFTRAMGPDVGVDRDINSFLQEFTSASQLVAASDEQTVAAAYFDGDIAALEQKIDARKADGKGTWRQWLRHLDDRNFKAANALLLKA